MAIKLRWHSWLCLFVVLLCSIRTIQLYLDSTKDLRVSNKQDPWYSQDKAVIPDATQKPIDYSEAIELADEPDKLFYFVQISDLHISKFQPKGHTIHFLHFLQSVLPVIKPEFVVVTGDLIDAKDKTRTTSKQYPEEWIMYQSAVDQGANKTLWFDMRGNHDCFDLIDWKADNNLYQDYGKSADILNKGKGVYDWKLSKAYGEYQFVAMDACPKKGPARPFNFFAYLTTNTMNRLVNTILPKKYNHTFMFAHYPTTTLVPGVSSNGYTFKDLTQHVSAYFCGHLHRLTAGLGDVLKSYDAKTDTLELELADMKDHGSYRIVAVDHDLISFVDIDLPILEIPPLEKNENNVLPLDSNNDVIWPKQKLNLPPVVLITNPKDARYTLPTKEPLHRTRYSTHIRFLVFSKYQHTDLKVNVLLDGKQYPFPAVYVGNNDTMPLWTTLWDANDFDDFESHTIEISVTTPDNQVGKGDVVFRMDKMRVKIKGGVGEWIIWSNMASLLRFLTLFALVSVLLVLVVPKIYNDYESHCKDSTQLVRNRILLSIHDMDRDEYSTIYTVIRKHMYIWVHRVLQFSEEQSVVWGVCFGFIVGLFCLPWFRAELIPSSKEQGSGEFYLWGLHFGNDQWVPLADTWMFAVFQVTFTVAVFILLFIWRSTNVYLLKCKGSLHQTTPLLCNRLWFQILIIIYWFWRCLGLKELAVWYGGVWPTLVLNLLTWWMVAVAVILVLDKDGLLSYYSYRKYTQSTADFDQCQACNGTTTIHPQVPELESAFNDDNSSGGESSSSPSSLERRISKRPLKKD